MLVIRLQDNYFHSIFEQLFDNRLPASLATVGRLTDADAASVFASGIPQSSCKTPVKHLNGYVLMYQNS